MPATAHGGRTAPAHASTTRYPTVTPSSSSAKRCEVSPATPSSRSGPRSQSGNPCLDAGTWLEGRAAAPPAISTEQASINTKPAAASTRAHGGAAARSRDDPGGCTRSGRRA